MSFYSVFRRKALLILLVAFALSCAGCASRQGEGTAPLTVASSAEGAPLPTQTVSDDAFEDYDDDDVSDISDPLEGWNRFWFKFNDVMLLHVIKPIYTGYTTVTPQPVRTGISNAFHNLQTPVRLVNCVLQGLFGEAWVEFGRFIVNTTAGFGGVFDVAKQSKPLIPVDNRDADFGQTLGVWGVGEGIYLVWPIAGPSTVRDTVGMVGDWAASPLFWTSDPVGPLQLEIAVAASLGFRFNDIGPVIDTYEALTKSAVEPYIAARDAYIKYRRAGVEKYRFKW